MRPTAGSQGFACSATIPDMGERNVGVRSLLVNARA
jgi:hypothetical protein